MQKLLIAAVLTVALTGCSGFPGVYKIDLPQGNVVTQEMVDQLRPGMTQNQVRFVMGSPLVTDTFHEGRWDYIYSMKSGSDDSYTRERISLYFTDGKLSGLNGDFRPGGGSEG
ncbi:outer membrane protein assembly factor BamE [Neptuniibacter halophilus]|uniref:outer membrane protein assembly factor BamE n=1 Tax=Neptuniibacter halophilus TaxID=651666 RepID=UPI00257291F2|nr:outer membrane protein assembly factor BamE [Neptuniibacter halophilus]